jgi:hypothetical protein
MMGRMCGRRKKLSSEVVLRLVREKSPANKHGEGQDVPLSSIKIEKPSSETSENQPSTTTQPQFFSVA